MVRVKRLAGLMLQAFAALAFTALAARADDTRAEAPPRADGLSALAEMSLEDLTDIDISSVSKRQEKRSSAAAAVYVITQEDIRRSTAVSLPDLLRMAPGIHVASLDASKRSVSSRGFSGRFANSLLVLVDGRSIYTPLFSGTEWEITDMMLEDIERIEIIRGPGGALWGANAVNGVVNIVTKNAADTQGGLLSLGGGTEYPGFGAFRYGDRTGEHGAYRLHLRYMQRDDAVFDSGGRAADDSMNIRGGGRWDWDWGDSRFTLVADLYGADTSQTFKIDGRGLLPARRQDDVSYFSGGSLLGRWTRNMDSGAQLSLQTYYDHQDSNSFELGESRDTLDFEAQYRMAAQGRHEFMFGAGLRYYDDRTSGTSGVSLDPASNSKLLFSAFVQDRITLLDDELILTLGTKLEHNDFTGVEIQPNVRLAWTPNERHTLWAAVSRAVRTPALVEVAARVESLSFPGVVASLYAGDTFDSEELLAFETGYRVVVSDELQLDFALFYNRYENLRSLELDTPFLELRPFPPHLAIPFRTRNNLEGNTYGFEVALDWLPASWWRIRLNYSLLEMDLDLKPVTLDIVTGATQESSPEQQVFLGSHFDLGKHTELDLYLRYIDRLAALDIEDYLTMDVRVAWKPSDDFEIAIVAHDLLDSAHEEFDSTFVDTVPTQVQRGVYGKITWRF